MGTDLVVIYAHKFAIAPAFNISIHTPAPTIKQQETKNKSAAKGDDYCFANKTTPVFHTQLNAEKRELLYAWSMQDSDCFLFIPAIIQNNCVVYLAVIGQTKT